VSKPLDEREHLPSDKGYKQPRQYRIEYRTKPERLAESEVVPFLFNVPEWRVWRWKKYRSVEERDQALAALQHKARSVRGYEAWFEFRAETDTPSTETP
jgi:hypothetical protein